MVTGSSAAKLEAGLLDSPGSGEDPTTEDLLSTVLRLGHRLMLVEDREREVITGVPSADVLDQEVIDEISHRQRLAAERQSSAMQRLEEVSAAAGTTEGSGTGRGHTQASALPSGDDSPDQRDLKASTPQPRLASGPKVTSQREADRRARKEKRRTERLV